MTQHIKVLLADDHELVRTGLKALLNDEEDIEVIAEAASGEQALRLAREKKPDVVLMDVRMPGIGGLEATRRMVRTMPEVRVIAVTSYSDDPYPAKLIKTGAAGFVAKDCPSAELLSAIRSVYGGQRYVSARVAQELAIRSASFPEDGSAERSLLAPLSDRELQILVMIGNGLPVQEIANQLHITAKTVNTYRYRLFRKLNVYTNVDLSHVAIRHGLVDIPAEMGDDLQ